MNRTFALAIAALLALWPVNHAKAISITIDSITKLSPTPNDALYYNNSTGGTLNTSGSNQRQSSYVSAQSVINAGTSAPDVIANQVTAGTRFSSAQTSDSDGLFTGDATLETTSNYQVLFTVNAPALPGYVYNLRIDTTRVGAFVIRDETSAGGSNNLGAVVGTFSAPASALSPLAALPGMSQSSTGNSAFNQSAFTVIPGITGGGIQQYTLNFTWTGRTQSTSGINGGDESVILMGVFSGLNGDVGAADDYPGTSGRTNQAADGHFVNIAATVVAVPEPTTFVLSFLGSLGLGLAYMGQRRRRRA